MPPSKIKKNKAPIAIENATGILITSKVKKIITGRNIIFLL